MNRNELAIGIPLWVLVSAYDNIRRTVRNPETIPRLILTAYSEESHGWRLWFGGYEIFVAKS
jgi:hypothetical protein